MQTYSMENERLNGFLQQGWGCSEMQGFANRYQMTLRELEILKLIALYGLSNREIAEQCVISEKTVKNHISNMMKKAGSRSMRQLLSCLFHEVLSSKEVRGDANCSKSGREE